MLCTSSPTLFFTATATTEIYTLSLHDALPISAALVTDLKRRGLLDRTLVVWGGEFGRTVYSQGGLTKDNYGRDQDRKSTRLNSSHVSISYAVFCLKKKKKEGISVGGDQTSLER